MQDEVFYGNFWKRYPSGIFDRVQSFILMFFIIICNFPKAANKPANVFYPMLQGTCSEGSLSFPLSTRLHLTTTYKRMTNYGALMKADKKLWNTFHLVLTIRQDGT